MEPGDTHFEDEIRDDLPRARPEFVARQVASLEARDRRAHRFRRGFVAALTAAILVALFGFGGLSYASGGAHAFAHGISKVAVQSSHTASVAWNGHSGYQPRGHKYRGKHKKHKHHHHHHNPGDDEYKPGRTAICHKSLRGYRLTLFLPDAAAQAHLTQHTGPPNAGPDYPGVCRRWKK